MTDQNDPRVDALQVVTAIKRDYGPDMDDNDGGQILVWIMDIVRPLQARLQQQEAQIATQAAQLRALVGSWRHSEIVAGQAALDLGDDIAVAHTFARCADELAALVFSPPDHP